jgi:hypothetical protein
MIIPTMFHMTRIFFADQAGHPFLTLMGGRSRHAVAEIHYFRGGEAF